MKFGVSERLACRVGEPTTLVAGHLLTIGWLSLAMVGALLQFVPVLVARPLSCPRLALPALMLIHAGLAELCTGFAAVSGLLPLPAALLPISGLILLSGFTLGTVSLAIEAVGIFRAATPLCLAGSLGVLAELIRIRRLAEIAPAKRSPSWGLPRLFLLQASQRGAAHDAVRNPTRPRA